MGGKVLLGRIGPRPRITPDEIRSGLSELSPPLRSFGEELSRKTAELVRAHLDEAHELGWEADNVVATVFGASVEMFVRMGAKDEALVELLRVTLPFIREQIARETK